MHFLFLSYLHFCTYFTILKYQVLSLFLLILCILITKELIKIKKFIFTFLLAISLITTKTYADYKTQIFKEGIHRAEFPQDVNAKFRNISSDSMTVIVLAPLKYLKLYTDLNVNDITSTKLITKEDVIVVIGSGEVVMEYDFSE